MQARAIFGPFKRVLFGSVPGPRRVLSGPIRGMTLHLDPANQSQYILGLHERETYGWIRRLAAGAGSAIDIGAASGELVLYLLGRTEIPQVLAFDPDDVSRVQFAENLKINGLTDDPRLTASHEYVRSAPGQGATTLDSLLPSLKLPCFVKIDVDGGETDILSGAAALLATRQARWLIETHSAELERECVRVLTESQYDVTIVRNAWWRVIIPEQRPIAHNRWLVALPRGEGRR